MDLQCLTLQELCEEFLRDNYHRPRTDKHYRHLLKTFERDTSVHTVAGVTREAALLWRTQALEVRGVRATTWNNYVRHMRALMNYAIRNQRCDHRTNPFAKLIISQPVKKKRTVSPETWSKVIACLKENQAAGQINPRKDRFSASWFWLIFLNTSDKTGMRMRQLVALKWRDLDFPGRTIRLRAESSKTNREWDIPMHAAIADDLAFLRRETIRRLGRFDPEGQVFNVNLFSQRHSQPVLTDEQVCRFCARVFKVTGCRISPHRLRHTLATDLMQQPERDLPTVRDLLGHTSIKTTLEYVVPDVEQMRSLLNSHRNSRM